MPSASASARSPLEVSSAIVVVITRVTWSMLPPTMITAPTSAIARPKPASSDGQQAVAAVPQQRRRPIAERAHAQRAELLGIFGIEILDHLPRQAATIGVTSTAWAMIIAVGV